MFKGYTLNEQEAHERYRQLLQEAQIERTLRANGLQNGPWQWLADKLGDLFIAVGYKLKKFGPTKLANINASSNGSYCELRPMARQTQESTN